MHEGGKGLLSMEDCVLAETKSFCEYLSTKEQPMLKERRSKNTVKRGDKRRMPDENTWQQN